MSVSSFHINLKSLQCFRAIIDTGSATAAAQQLQLTQPGVSRLLSLLEEAIGFPLFHRGKGRLIPTDEAITFYKEVDIALQSVDRVVQLARNLRNENFGELTIVSPPSFAEGILSQVIAEFIRLHPNVQVSLDSQSVETARDMVALRAVDCGFIKLPADHAGLACEPLVRAGTICALPSEHRLCRKKIITVKDLADQPLILLGKGRTSRQQIEDAFRDAGVKMQVKVETHTVGAACAFARSGTGIAIINEMLGVQYMGSGIAFRRFRPNLRQEYAFMTSANAPMTRVTRKFLDFCRDYLRSNPQLFTLRNTAG